MLLRQIERFLRQTGMPWTKFGRLAIGDPRFVHDLRNGREPREAMTRRVQTFMSSYHASQEDHLHVR